jgi:hypothetical protein
MSDSDSITDLAEGWAASGIQYLEEHGWEIVPLTGNSKSAAESCDHAVNQLGAVPIVDLPEGALTSKQKILEVNETQPDNSPLGVQTGTGSGIAAIEVGPAATRAMGSDKVSQLKEALPETLWICGPDREYYLFEIPERETRLPQISRSDGVILHGENSLLRVPLMVRSVPRAYKWGLNSADEPAPFPEALLSFFGIKSSPDDLLLGDMKSKDSSCPSSSDRGGRASAMSELSRSNRPDNASCPFRSGEELTKKRGEAATERVPWLAPEALSVLTGAPKTSGKSTFAVNLAAHVAAGRPFLGYPLAESPVVILSDLPSSRLQALLRRLELDRDVCSRIHAVTPRDVQDMGWSRLLTAAFDHASCIGAGLLVLDSLDQYIRAKGGIDSCENREVVHTLKMKAPPDCATLAVKALAPRPSEGLRFAIRELGLLGQVADVVMQMDAGPAHTNQALRRLQVTGRLEATPGPLLCEMAEGKYCRRRLESTRSMEARGDGTAPALSQPSGDESPEAEWLSENPSSKGRTSTSLQ